MVENGYQKSNENRNYCIGLILIVRVEIFQIELTKAL